MVFSADADGLVNGHNEFDLTLKITVSEKTPGSCSELEGDTLDIGLPVPFPALHTAPPHS